MGSKCVALAVSLDFFSSGSSSGVADASGDFLLFHFFETVISKYRFGIIFGLNDYIY